MRRFHTIIHSLLLVTSSSLLAYPQNHSSLIQQVYNQEIPYANFNLTYDEFLHLLCDIEEGRINDFSEEQLEKISRLFSYLAQIGMLPGEAAAHNHLKSDIATLFEIEEDVYDFVQYADILYVYTILPTLMYGKDDTSSFLCKHKQKKEKHKSKHKKHLGARIKRFVKKHKKAIIIGVVVIIAATAVVAAVAAASTAAAASKAAIAAATTSAAPALAQQDKGDTPSSPQDSTKISSEIATNIQAQLTSFQEKIAQDQLFQSADPAFWQQGLSWEENGRILGSLLAHDGFHTLQNQVPYCPGFAQASAFGDDIGHPKIDHQFSTNYSHLFTHLTPDVNFDVLSHQMRGEKALAWGCYDQAVHDFGRVIEANPTNPLPYLERGIAHFELGQYENSLKDYEQFTEQTSKTNPLSISEFSLGVAKGAPKGIYESGEGILFFLADFVTHPIQTSTQLVNSVTALVQLAREDQWEMIAEALSPEMHQLVTQWETLSSEQRGELAGYAIGKHGTDILTPGALAKVANKSMKCAQELMAVAKNMQIAQDILFLETAAGIGNSAKISEMIEAGQRITRLGDELGFTTAEIGQLKQAGQLETTIAKNYEHLSLSMKESIAFYKRAQETLEPYAKKPFPEFKVRELIHKTGIPTFPRPEGIPEDFLVMISEKGAGMEYVHPMNPHFRVRVMPGKPHSPNPCQQKPYVIQKTDKGALDKAGNYISTEAPEAHIPIEEFLYKDLNGNK